MVGQVIALVLQLYIFVLIARLVFDWIQVFAREWRPRGPILVLANGIYTLTDPPLMVHLAAGRVLVGWRVPLETSQAPP